MLVLKKIKKQWRLYPIGSPKGALNHKREPEFVGNIKFLDDGESLSISRFVADYNFKDNSTLNEKLIPPGEVTKLLRSQAVFLATPDKKVENFLKSLNIKVRRTQVCDFCAYEGNITIVNSSYSYKWGGPLQPDLQVEQARLGPPPGARRGNHALLPGGGQALRGRLGKAESHLYGLSVEVIT